MPNITRKWTKWIAGFDPHGVYQDKEANRAFFKFLTQWKPEIRVAGGDVIDAKQLRKKADAHERRESLAIDFSEGKTWLEKLRATHYLRGNHCQRIWDLAEQGEGIVQDYAKILVRDIDTLMIKMRCQMFPYNKRDGVLQIGSLKLIHGFRAGVNAARMSAKTYGSVLMGHGHAIQCATIEGLEPRTGWMCGALCQLDFDYNRASEGTLMHEHGWAYGVVDKNSGAFQVWQARRVGGVWLLPTGVEEL